MAGIIFSEQPPMLNPRGISRRRLLALTSGTAAGIAFRPSRAMRGQATPPDTSDKLDEIDRGGPERLAELLSHVPIGLLSLENGNGVLFVYADVAQQLDSVGIHSVLPSEDRPSRNPLLALYPLATASPAFRWAADEAFTSAIGFQPLESGQTLVTGTPPGELTLFQGGMDLERLPKAWEASGYELVPTDEGVQIWTVGETGEVDFDSTMGTFGMPSLNNATVLENGIVMFAHRYDCLVSAIETANTGTGSMLEDDRINAVIAAMPNDTVSAIAATSEYVALEPQRIGSRATPDLDLEADEGEQMPAYRSFAMGITAGFMDPDVQPNWEGTPDAAPKVEAPLVIPDGGVIFARLVAESEDDAALIAGIVEKRWNEQASPVLNRPYTDLMTVKEAGADGKVAILDFVPVVLPSVWLKLLAQRDLAPFAANS